MLDDSESTHRTGSDFVSTIDHITCPYNKYTLMKRDLEADPRSGPLGLIRISIPDVDDRLIVTAATRRPLDLIPNAGLVASFGPRLNFHERPRNHTVQYGGTDFKSLTRLCFTANSDVVVHRLPAGSTKCHGAHTLVVVALATFMLITPAMTAVEWEGQHNVPTANETPGSILRGAGTVERYTFRARVVDEGGRGLLLSNTKYGQNPNHSPCRGCEACSTIFRVD